MAPHLAAAAAVLCLAQKKGYKIKCQPTELK